MDSRPLDMKEVNNTLLELLKHDRVAMADYKLIEEDEKVIVEYVVKRKPQKEYAFSGYSTNISSDNRWAAWNTCKGIYGIRAMRLVCSFGLGKIFARASYVGSEEVTGASSQVWPFKIGEITQKITARSAGKVFCLPRV